MPVTTCAQCKAVLDESPQQASKDVSPCPYCGSTLRLYKMLMQNKVEAKSYLGLKARHGNSRKPFVIQKSGASFFHKAQKWVYRVMRIDRDNDNYSETVVDPETNEVIHECRESLSKHQGHGSAKKK